ncbi:hypothetical protein HF882_21600 [Victivallis vadensis]|uniref:Carbohydrate-binding domain-containing protein n=1 Tax=Victivallis vadensis TaxID=172901 RepID=A0A848B014_9BACT|nr:hypothetical protein [Victivallis vadensis]NMD89185.1 hypothetical protein [Victivallis vadensis]
MRFKLFFLLLGICGGALLTAAPLDYNMGKGDQPELQEIPEAGKFGWNNSYQINPLTGKNALCVQYNAKKKSFCKALFLPQSIQIYPVLKRRYFQVDLSVPENARHIWYCQLIFADSSNQWHTFGKYEPILEPGRASIVIPVNFDAAHYHYSNGSKFWFHDAMKFKPEQYPVRLVGIQFGLKEDAAAGRIFVDRIRELPYDSADSVTPVCAGLAENLLAVPVMPVLETSAGTLSRPDGTIRLENCASKEILLHTYVYEGQAGCTINSPKLPDFYEGKFSLEFSAPESSSEPMVKLGIVDATNHVFLLPGKLQKSRDEGPWIADFQFDATKIFQGERRQIARCESLRPVDQPVPPFRLASLSFQFPEKISSLNVLKLTPQLRLPRSAGMELSVETGDVVRILRPGREKDLRVVLKNCIDKTVDYDVEVALRNYRDQYTPWLKLGKMRFAPGESRVLPIPAFKDRGLYFVECRLRSLNDPGDSRWIRGSRSFAYLEPTGSTPLLESDDFLFGICCLSEYYPYQADEFLKAMMLIGVKNMRCGSTEKDVAFARKYHMTIDIVLGLESFYDRKKVQVNEELLQSYLDRVFRKAGVSTRYELDNELDTGSNFSVEDCVKSARAVEKYLHAKKPGYLFMSTGFCTFEKNRKFDCFYQEEVMKQTRDMFQIHCFHAYESIDRTFYPKIEMLLDKRREWGVEHIPWYLNETGDHGVTDRPRLQAQNIAKRFIYSWSRGAIGVCYYAFNDAGEDKRYTEDYFGLVSYDGYPKPNFVAYNTMTGILQRQRYKKQLTPRNSFLEQIHLFANGRQTVLAGWNEDGLNVHEIKCDAPEAEIVDIMGNRHPAEKKDGNWLMPIDRDGSYLIFNGSWPVELVR